MPKRPLQGQIIEKPLQRCKFDLIIRIFFLKILTLNVIKSGFLRNNDTTSKKVSGGSKNLTLAQKCKSKTKTKFILV